MRLVEDESVIDNRTEWEIDGNSVGIDLEYYPGVRLSIESKDGIRGDSVLFCDKDKLITVAGNLKKDLSSFYIIKIDYGEVHALGVKIIVDSRDYNDEDGLFKTLVNRGWKMIK